MGKKSKKKVEHKSRIVTLHMNGEVFTHDISTDEGLSSVLDLFLAIMGDILGEVERFRFQAGPLGSLNRTPEVGPGAH